MDTFHSNDRADRRPDWVIVREEQQRLRAEMDQGQERHEQQRSDQDSDQDSDKGLGRRAWVAQATPATDTGTDADDDVDC